MPESLGRDQRRADRPGEVDHLGVRRLPVVTILVITSVGSASTCWALDPASNSGYAHADELVHRLVERGPDARAEAEGPLELVEQ